MVALDELVGQLGWADIVLLALSIIIVFLVHTAHGA